MYLYVIRANAFFFSSQQTHRRWLLISSPPFPTWSMTTTMSSFEIFLSHFANCRPNKPYELSYFTRRHFQFSTSPHQSNLRTSNHLITPRAQLTVVNFDEKMAAIIVSSRDNQTIVSIRLQIRDPRCIGWQCFLLTPFALNNTYTLAVVKIKSFEIHTHTRTHTNKQTRSRQWRLV